MQDRVHCHAGDPQTPSGQHPVTDLGGAQLVCVGVVDELSFLLASERCVFFAKDAHVVRCWRLKVVESIGEWGVDSGERKKFKSYDLWCVCVCI